MKYFADSPANLAFVEAHFLNMDASSCDAFLDTVDDSSYTLRDWVEALRCMGQWLDAHGMTMELKDQIGYVNCAGAAAGSGANLTHLPSLVDEMLETYGCERAVKK